MLLVFTLTVVTLKCNAEAFSKEEHLPLNHLTPPPPHPHVLTGGMHIDLSLIQHLNDCDLSHLQMTAASTSHYKHILKIFFGINKPAVLLCSSVWGKHGDHWAFQAEYCQLWCSDWLKCSGDWQPRLLYTTLLLQWGNPHGSSNTTKCETAHILNII